MHLTSEETPPSFSSPQYSHHLLELIELNSNINIQFAILEPWNITCSVWRNSFCDEVWMWYIFNRIHRVWNLLHFKRYFTSPGGLSLEGFHSQMSICSFFHSAYRVSCTSEDTRNCATNFKSKPDLENRHKYNKLHDYTAKASVTLLNKHISSLLASLAGSVLVELRRSLETVVWYERV